MRCSLRRRPRRKRGRRIAQRDGRRELLEHLALPPPIARCTAPTEASAAGESREGARCARAEAASTARIPRPAGGRRRRPGELVEQVSRARCGRRGGRARRPARAPGVDEDAARRCGGIAREDAGGSLPRGDEVELEGLDAERAADPLGEMPRRVVVARAEPIARADAEVARARSGGLRRDRRASPAPRRSIGLRASGRSNRPISGPAKAPA